MDNKIIEIVKLMEEDNDMLKFELEIYNHYTKETIETQDMLMEFVDNLFKMMEWLYGEDYRVVCRDYYVICELKRSFDNIGFIEYELKCEICGDTFSHHDIYCEKCRSDME